MKKIFKRRGQATVEFALILPIFALLLFALIYLGSLFIDYVTLDSAAGAAARSAAQRDDRRASQAVIDRIQEKTVLFSPWYTLDENAPMFYHEDEIIDENDPSKKSYFITYKVSAKLNTTNFLLEWILPPEYSAVKTAYKEP